MLLYVHRCLFINSLQTHVTATVRSCFAALWQICSVWRCLARHALLLLICALVVIKVDYCSSVLVGVSRQLLYRLQSILNAAAWLVFSVRRSERITPLLRELHWLQVLERITFRLCVLTHRCLNGSAPAYLAENIRLTADVESRRHLRSSTTTTLVVLLVQRSTLGDRAFPVAAPRAWNSLPSFLWTVSSLVPFRHQLKTFLFVHSFDWHLLISP